MSGEIPQPPSSNPPTPEIERTFLLDGLPDLPAGAEEFRIEQGYLPPPEAPPDVDPAPDMLQGRLRRTEDIDGAVRYCHTIKRGEGLVREEINLELTREDFERWWPHTEKRRLTKTRYRIAQGNLTWEIDDFEGFDIVLADVELPTPETRIEIPEWLASHVIREVTDDPEYRNYDLARSSRT